MQRCLELALLGAGTTAPNPMVGSVVVYNDRIIGEGFTSPYGGNHAEVNAINSVEDETLLPRSTIYVSLEPCAHFGKTPPCSDLIISKRIKRVVVACLDPFAKVNGLGIKRLVESGAEVKLGVLEKEALELNRRFMTFHQQKRPYIILKWAETADGFVDGNRNDPSEPALKITCEASNILVHKWRSEEAAIMVGKNTAIWDDPALTTRKHAGRDPVRILIDPNLETPRTARILNGDAKTIVFTASNVSNTQVDTITVSDTRDLTQILGELYRRDIQSVIVEGGPTLHGSFYQAGLWDEIRRFVAPMEIASGVRAINLAMEPESESVIGSDRLHIYRNR